MKNTTLRRFAIYFFLKPKEFYRNSELASKYKVSIRTIECDIEFLANAKIITITYVDDINGIYSIERKR
ncbi:MAG: hypothetical protein IKQ71_07275 [Lachnospiraceae bacterium]|nr:hypothetical protein [Lachnospiraceae bacterium]